MYRSLLFKLGIIPLLFLLWGWRDSISHYTDLSFKAVGHDLTVYHACSRLYIEFSSGGATGFPREFEFFRKAAFDGKTAFSGASKRFPSPDFRHEVPDLPFEQLSEDDSFRAELGEGAGGITIPYWLILLTYVILWFGLSHFTTRRRKLGSAANSLTDTPHGKISP